MAATFWQISGRNPAYCGIMEIYWRRFAKLRDYRKIIIAIYTKKADCCLANQSSYGLGEGCGFSTLLALWGGAHTNNLPLAHPAPAFEASSGRNAHMAAFARSTISVCLTALAAGTAFALLEGCDGTGQPVVPADRVAAALPRGESGFSLDDEGAAVAAVLAHLSSAGVPGQLGDVRLYSLGLPDEVVVCATLPVRGTDVMQIVARVVLMQPTQAARMALPAGQAAPVGRASMVIMEAGPGLGRGGSQAGPGLRYCRDPQAPPASGAAALPVTGGQAPRTGAEPGMRLVVIAPARVRTAPRGDATVLWTAPRGRSYVVLGHAPGGWVNIGDGEAALGWAHSSLLGPAP